CRYSRPLHSFPARRSSDLCVGTGARRPLRYCGYRPVSAAILSACLRGGYAVNETLISLIIPVYNAGPWLAPCLASITAQTHPARSEEHTSELQSRFDLVCR